MKTARAIAASLVLVACTGSDHVAAPRFFGAGATTPHRGGTLTFATTDDIRSLDPAIGYDEYSIYAQELLFDTLLTYAPADAPDPTALVPQLAASWSVSPDGLTYSFTLRRGVTFSDGEPLVAGDFVYTLQRIRDPALGSAAPSFYEGITEITAPDDLHLTIRLSKPDASFPLLLAMKWATPMKRSHVERVGARLRDTPLGTGPFVLSEWKPGERLVFTRNPRYWDPGKPYLDKIVLLPLVPRDVAVLKFLAGEIDTVDRLSADDYRKFSHTPEWAPYIQRMQQMAVFGELMDVTKPPFNDKRVRQAMNYAFNKEDSIKLTANRVTIAHGILPPGLLGYDPTVPPYPHDPEKARRLLAEAGYPHGFDINYVTLNDETMLRTAQSLQADLAEVGVRMRIQLMTFPAYLTAVGKRRVQFGYASWFMDFPDPWNFIEIRFHSRFISDDNSQNDSGYANPELDRLLEQGRVELDRDKRAALYRRAEAILYDDCPWIWHYHPLAVEVVQPYVRGYHMHPVWIRGFRDAWLDEPRSTR